MSAAPHYGLRYGSAPATGDFQRLRGRPPLVSPLKSCMTFTAVTRVQIPSGTPNQYLTGELSTLCLTKGSEIMDYVNLMIDGRSDPEAEFPRAHGLVPVA
jgi:hypothetical protein